MATNNIPDQGSLPPKPRRVPLQFKRGKSTAWWDVNPILLNGEPGYEYDTHKLKIGDGRTEWRRLPYISDHYRGKDGKSAYQLWLEVGNKGTLQDFLDSLIGEPGKSAYEIWLSLGNEGTVEDFIAAIHGAKGDTGKSAYDLWIDQGHTGTITDFLNSLKGKSAYEIWLELGHEGTEQDFIDSLKGKSAYQSWLDQGHTGTEADFLESLKGKDGKDGAAGKSAYEVWLDQGHTGTETDFLNSLRMESVYAAWVAERKAEGLDYSMDTFLKSITESSWGQIGQ